MNDFETFKASREKIDPSARKFSQAQWEKAYVAYRSSRERVMEATDSAQSNKEHGPMKRRRSESNAKSGRGYASPSQGVELRNEIRHKSAYSDLRMTIDLLTWITLGLVVLSGALRLLYYTNVSAALVAIIQAVILVVTVVALRLLAHVIIDIPDIALHAARNKSPQDSSRKP